jgi:uncharacterized protein (DUF1800 family)
VELSAAFIAVNRFGLGARPGDVAAIAGNPQAWVMEQILRGRTDPVPGVQDTQSRLRAVDVFFKAMGEAQKAEAEVARAAAEGHAMPAPAVTPSVAPDGKPKPPSPLDIPPVKFLENDVSRRAEQMTVSDWPLSERLAAFWSNHFTISNIRGEIAVLAVPYENEAIRPFVFGTFHDMLWATATHPAMMFYLDSASSIGPDSPVGLRRRQSVNENYAREVMELHTLGVGGGYTQQDVQQLALVLTGLGLDRADGEGAWFYDRHEPGERILLGHKLPDGTDQARAALAVLADHPAAIRHVCTKLAAHFCGDSPPDSVVSRLSETWRISGGSLPAVYKVLVDAPEAWVTRPVKYRTPQDFVVAAARALGLRSHGRQMLEEMRLLGHMPFQAPAPNGWSDLDSTWLDPGGVMGRVESAQRLASLADTRIDAAAVLPQVVYASPGSMTIDVVQDELSPREAIALVLASPEFQRR